MLWYKRAAVLLLNMFLDFKSKQIIKGAIAQVERKQGTLTWELNPSENLNIRNKN